ncbi:MAG: zinc-binding dehydrogenase [Comamonadaceae bacterium]|nr:zinc-binding dehydrogenase [Comamonadaceae bacterium]
MLFHAAAGGVGLIACQWAKALGPAADRHRGQRRPSARWRWSTARRTRSTTRKEDFVARVKEITGGKGVKVVYDSVGKDTFERSARLPAAVRPDGQLRQRRRARCRRSRSASLGAQGLAVPDARRRCSRTSPRARRTQAMADDLFAVVRQRRGEDPHRPALPAGGRGRRRTATLEARKTTGSTMLLP